MFSSFNRVIHSAADRPKRDDRVMEYAKLGVALLGYGVSIYCVYKTGVYMNQILGLRESNNDLIEVKKDLAKRLGRPDIEVIDLTPHEAKLVPAVIASDEISETFNDIGGMEEQLDSVMENIVYPIQMHTMYRSTAGAIKCPTGVLLYGRPGTGKTLTAKAVAKETGVTFLNIKSSMLFEKYIGKESSSLLFSMHI